MPHVEQYLPGDFVGDLSSSIKRGNVVRYSASARYKSDDDKDDVQESAKPVAIKQGTTLVSGDIEQVMSELPNWRILQVLSEAVNFLKQKSPAEDKAGHIGVKWLAINLSNRLETFQEVFRSGRDLDNATRSAIEQYQDIASKYIQDLDVVHHATVRELMSRSFKLGVVNPSFRLTARVSPEKDFANLTQASPAVNEGMASLVQSSLDTISSRAPGLARVLPFSSTLNVYVHTGAVEPFYYLDTFVVPSYFDRLDVDRLVAHFLGVHVEHVYAPIQLLAHEHLERVTTDSPNVRMNEFVPEYHHETFGNVSGFASVHENTNDIQQAHQRSAAAYTGMQYDFGATEVVSVGLTQYIYSPDLLRSNVDYYEMMDFILGS